MLPGSMYLNIIAQKVPKIKPACRQAGVLFSLIGKMLKASGFTTVANNRDRVKGALEEGDER
jgi:hypothetical protein